MSEPDQGTPSTPAESSSSTTDEAERIAHNAVDSLQELVEAAGDLTADTAKLVLSTAHDLVAKLESVVRGKR